VSAAPSPPVYLVSFGMVASTGATVTVATAAARAAVTRITLDETGGEDLATNVAAVCIPATEDPETRALAMLRIALAEATREFEPRVPLTLGIWLGGLPSFGPKALLLRALGEREAWSKAAIVEVGAQGSASLRALDEAARALSDGQYDVALVAAFDVRTDPASLASGLAAGRTIGPGRSWGYVPGDAAAAVLLSGPRLPRDSGLTPELILIATGTGHEPVPPGGSAPCLGTGLSEAARGALAGLPSGGQVDIVIADVNGERARSDEWGFTVPRVADRLKDPGAFLAPALTWGDCGVVNGLLAVALAHSLLRHHEAPDAHVLIWTAGDGHERGAALLARARSTSVARVAARDVAGTELPDWAATLDAEIIETLIDECIFRYQQRTVILAGLCDGEQPKSWAPLERSEDQLDTLTVCLADIGRRAFDKTASTIDPEEPGTLYVAIRALLEAGELDVAIALAAVHVAETPSFSDAVLDAFGHALAAGAAPARAVPALFAAGGPLGAIALNLAATTSTAVDARLLDQVSPTISGHRALHFARAVGLTGAHSAARHLERLLSSAHDDERREAAVSALLLNPSDVADWIMKGAAADPALLLPAALASDRRSSRRICELAAAEGTPDGLLALGLTGDPFAVNALLQALSGPHGTTAVTALELLLGEAPSETTTKPDEDPSAPPRQIERLSLEWGWAPLAERLLRSHPASLRLRNGRPSSLSQTLSLIQRPHLSPEARRWLGLELGVRYGVRPLPDPTALLRVQREAWTAIAGAPTSQSPGSWSLATGVLPHR
jgi:3-oxoacyl-[acyl-carrier-protein] synthase-1